MTATFRATRAVEDDRGVLVEHLLVRERLVVDQPAQRSIGQRAFTQRHEPSPVIR